MKQYTFKNRDDVVEFLDNHNFKYYIPRLREYMSNIKDELKYYYIEVSNSEEVENCYIVSISGEREFKENFFDINKVDEFKDTAYNIEYRDSKYKEGIEHDYF
ncbi:MULTISPECIES: hypothetical protein [unclassified Romboutsia]|uniref:hypothetical protein n=1 Tax=unclassified Romboutsia TaxID=2626894 RepID=UPI000820638B|nr:MULTISPECIES: hypothetical protein [unclassified Romboutsia]SCH74276.1 Uncharacterised protein [uncultured Clostridium sp.]